MTQFKLACEYWKNGFTDSIKAATSCLLPFIFQFPIIQRGVLAGYDSAEIIILSGLKFAKPIVQLVCGQWIEFLHFYFETITYNFDKYRIIIIIIV